MPDIVTNLGKYKTLVFDCDGVILDSNKLKTEAFFQAALRYGEDHARFLVDYHRTRGGVSRFEKFRFFLDEYLGIDDPQGEHLDELLLSYANIVTEGLCACACTPGLHDLREQTADARWMIVSGGKQDELRNIFSLRKIDQLFDAGIFGSPDTKGQIVERELEKGTLRKDALFFGDSEYDYRISRKYGLDFLFVSQWTEMPEWQFFCKTEGIEAIALVGDTLHPEKADV